ncbi:putative transcription factor FAR family [Helianthus debilis subsp. tardiflorus]
MEFESYDDAYNYYNCYARESGFRVRVKNSWFKRNSREKYGAVLCCSSQGFKRIKDVNRLRKETRTGCPAMVRMRLVDSRRWRILEVTLDHNHLLGVKVHKSIKKMVQSDSDAEGRTIKLYKALVIDSRGNNGNSHSHGREIGSSSSVYDHPDQLNLKKGDAQAIYNYLFRMQLTNPNFFYLMDLNDEGRLRNMIWLDARCRGAVGYFSDVIYFDTSYLSNKYEIPLVTFTGMNHHYQSVLLVYKYIHKQTPLKEFLDKYELALQKKHKEEANADVESRNSSPTLKTRCFFELQLSKVYTHEIFKKFQLEVEEMYSCFSTTQLHVDGAITIFLVKERVLAGENRREIKDFEVLYNRGAADVRCICSCFNFNGYLCRHALCVLNFNGVEEIPSKYILSRWKKDYKRLYVSDYDGINSNDGTDTVEWFNQLYRSALQVVEEGVISLDHYKVALQTFEESLSRVHNIEDKT